MVEWGVSAGGRRRWRGLDRVLVAVACGCAAALVVLGLAFSNAQQRNHALLVSRELSQKRAGGAMGGQGLVKWQRAEQQLSSHQQRAKGGQHLASHQQRSKGGWRHLEGRQQQQQKLADASLHQQQLKSYMDLEPRRFAYDAVAYGADGGGSGWKLPVVGSQSPVQSAATWEYPGFVCYDPNGCSQPKNPDETVAEAKAEEIADDPSYYGDGGVDDMEVGSPLHSPTPYRGTYMHATFPYESEPTGFFAGWHTAENTGLNVGMGKHRDVNSYFYPEAVRVTTGQWHFKNYDLDGSYMVSAYGEYNGTLPVLNTVTGREQYTVPSNHTGPDPADFSGVGAGFLWENKTREGGGLTGGEDTYTGVYYPFVTN